MAVRIVTDSAACIPRPVTDALGITVLNMHVNVTDKVTTTAGLSSLELAAAYARQLERGSHAGVLAIHLSKEMSSTWSSAVTASGVFNSGDVRIVDSRTVGPVMGAACIAAATAAQEGRDLDLCYREAMSVLDNSETWLYVHRLDELRRSGRLSAASALFSTALAMRPVLHVHDGKLEIAAKTRTQSKAFARLAQAVELYCTEQPAFVCIMHYEAREASKQLADAMRSRLHPDSRIICEHIPPVLAVHTGPETIALSVTRGNPTRVLSSFACE